ncbi:MAG: tRNA pseudouridine(55) synthase TruB, partial [Clostridia bacterium]|nr:tRNA pseudouridine(55) synthase TruB [Clostridia bacterium]
MMTEKFNKSGIIILNKESGISSNTAVNKVKRILKANKAGHLGTLDVLGEGVLPVTLNKATRLFDFFLKKDKTYRATFCFGFETTTLDCEGEIKNIDYRLVSEFEIVKATEKFKGKIKQMPPQYSALKVGGKTAYDLARKGEEVALKEREVEIYDFKLIKAVEIDKKTTLIDRFLKFHDIKLLETQSINDSLNNNVFEFEITCSSGTYIRALCRDIAKELSTCGTML